MLPEIWLRILHCFWTGLDERLFLMSLMLAGLFLDSRQSVLDVCPVSKLSPVSKRWFEQQKNVPFGFLVLWSGAVHHYDACLGLKQRIFIEIKGSVPVELCFVGQILCSNIQNSVNSYISQFYLNGLFKLWLKFNIHPYHNIGRLKYFVPRRIVYFILNGLQSQYFC